MRIEYRAFLLLLAIGALSACGGGQSSSDTSTVLATVNGTPITTDMYRAYLRTLTGGQEPQLDPQRKAMVLNRLVDMEVLAQSAKKENLESKPDVAAEMHIQNTGLLANQMVQAYLAKHPITDDQIKAEYDQRVKSMPGIEYRARHILVPTEKLAKEIINKLNHGANFATLAKQYSTDTSKDQGGELGWFSPDQMVPAFSQAVEKLKKGEYTKEPVHSQFGWHVIQLQDTRSNPPPSLAAMKDQLKNTLEGKEVEAYVNDLRQSAKVVMSTPAAASKASPPAAAPPASTKP
ncbi:MAG: peptidylprolyl isomerase [Gammaproteobacteria bacterium]|nr:peptidylprolyl isomerase [Gammaproteobacteria bacterium]MDE2346735.1 peptidylprolyl isomerase [Gammaproteobacteria bacterium]